MANALTKQADLHVLIPVDLTYGEITDRIVGVPLQRGFPTKWLMLFGAFSSLLLLGVVSTACLLLFGPGIWGLDIPVAWGFAIVNFVWWIGIGHAGTLISAILLLFRQKWRNSINRFAEAMTLFALVQAGLFPILHLGRPWLFYYLAPYPNTMELWPQWRSPLVWDMFAVATYSTVSLLFWYLGLLPDLATMRDCAKRHWIRVVTGALSLGWRGSARHWQHYQKLYLLLAGMATPLVVSVHSIVSLDFSVSTVPGWHSTVFPPYFVAGAIFSGFAMVFTIAIPLRAAFGFKDLISAKHLDNMAKVMLASGLIVAYGYLMETFTAWYSGDKYERYVAWNRAFGPYGPLYWALLFCNVVVVQALWSKWVRTNPSLLFVISIFINIGMWLERFIIIPVSLHRDFLPSSWGMYIPTIWDWTLLIGSLGFFAVLMLIFVRLLPMISIFEMRELIHERGEDDRASPPPEDPPQVDPQQPLPGAVQEECLYGLAAEFSNAKKLVHAAREARQTGYYRIDAFSPFPIQELPDALELRRSPVAIWALIGAAIGSSSAYAMQWYSATVDYPWNIGGRPLHSWPSFIPLTFELGILGGALFGFVSFLMLSRFPRPYHPLLNVKPFWRASRDRFFLCIDGDDPNFSRKETREFLQAMGAVQVSEVPA